MVPDKRNGQLSAGRSPAPLKWHGGKWYLAQQIVALMPPRCANPNKPDPADAGWLHYVEAYAGGLSVLLANDPEGISEVVNDKNAELTNFWTVLANPELFAHFHRKLQATPFSNPEWLAAGEGLNADHRAGSFDNNGGISVVRAAWFFTYCRQSLAGRMDSFAPLTRNRTRRGMNEQASAWLSAVEGLLAVHERLKRVVVLNDDALAVIRQQDGPRTLFYLDPPYLGETRTADDVYRYEMAAAQHADLLDAIRECRGRVMISGYASSMYDTRLSDWTRHEFVLPNQAAGGKIKRRMTEIVWCNF